MIKKDDSGTSVVLDFEDEIIAAAALTHAGEIRNEQVRQAMGLPSKNPSGENAVKG